MVTDFYIKPLQGKLFRVFCNQILNFEGGSCIDIAKHQNLNLQQGAAHESKQDSGMQECVGQSGDKNGKGKDVLANLQLVEHVSMNMVYESTAKLWGRGSQTYSDYSIDSTDTVDANLHLSFPDDCHQYSIVLGMLK
eukprot:2732589-Ditylum_brightwellii.AAC.1